MFHSLIRVCRGASLFLAGAAIASSSGFLSAPAAADPIPAARVDHVSSELTASFDRPARATVNGSGLNINGPNTHSNLPDGTGAAGDGTMWLSAGNTNCCGGKTYVGNVGANIDNTRQIGFDLGGLYSVNSVRVWNYNEVAAGLMTRGINSANILVSSNGITYTNPFGGPVALNIAPGNDTTNFSQLVNFPASTTARFVRVNALTNHGDANGFVGLSEVKFDGALAASNPSQTLVNGVTATASSQLLGGFNRQAQFAVNGAGLTPATGVHTVTPDGFMWLTTGNGAAGGGADANPQITFNLGAPLALSQMQIWNYNEAGLNNRGIDAVTVQTSLDGVTFSNLFTTNLFAAPGDGTFDFHQTFQLDARAQYVRFANLTNHGDGNNFIGLSEVRFFSQSLTALPEPGSIALWTMLGLAGGAFGWRARRGAKAKKA